MEHTHHGSALAASLAALAGATASSACHAQTWSAFWNGRANLYDHGREIALLAGGGVVATGESWHTDNSWAMVVAAFTREGAADWSHVYVGPFPTFHYDRGISVETDAEGNIYALGVSSGGPRTQGGTDWDYVLLKFSPSGQLLWTRRYNGLGNWADTPQDLAVDDLGNAYIVGNTFVQFNANGGYGTDYHVIKYTPTGDVAWEYRTNGPGNFGAIARAVALGPGGLIYSTGQVASGSGKFDFIGVCLTDDGHLVYRTIHSTPGVNSGEDDGQRIAVDDLGNAYISGQWMPDPVQGGPDRHRDTLTMKIAPSGQVLWTTSTTRVREEDPYDIVIGQDGRVYVAGAWHNTLGADGWIECYSPSGQLLWEYVAGEPNNFDEEAFIGLAIAPDGSIVGCLPDENPGPAGEDVSFLTFTPTGQLVSRTLHDAGSTTDHAWDFEVDAQGNFYTGGYSYRGPSTDSDLFVLRVASNASCYADCDTSTGPGLLDIFDFLCFQNRFASASAYACDCDTSTGAGVCDIFDFLCFQNAFTAGCR